MKTVDVSGMGGSYENACQMMLWRGVEYLENQTPEWLSELKLKEYKDIHGIITAKTAQAKALIDHIVKDVNPSGAQVQCIIGHLCFIAGRGVAEWLGEFEEARCYNWDGTVGGCPVTKLSKRMER